MGSPRSRSPCFVGSRMRMSLEVHASLRFPRWESMLEGAPRGSVMVFPRLFCLWFPCMRVLIREMFVKVASPPDFPTHAQCLGPAFASSAHSGVSEAPADEASRDSASSALLQEEEATRPEGITTGFSLPPVPGITHSSPPPWLKLRFKAWPAAAATAHDLLACMACLLPP